MKLVWHVTDKIAAESILAEGFRGGWGDDGFGVYLFSDPAAALRYAEKGGWSEDIEAGDTAIIEITADEDDLTSVVVHPEWPNPEFYHEVLYHPMDSDVESVWTPIRRLVIEENAVDHEIISDGKTVWINDATGCCIGRLSRFGIDIHKTGEEQMLTGTQCLDCAHDVPKDEMWCYFTASMLRNHGVLVPENHRPTWAPEPVAHDELAP